MRQQDIKNQLKTLQRLEPDSSYAQSSKFEILYNTPAKPGKFVLFSQSISSTVSMGLAVLFFVFVALGGVATILRNPVFPTFESVDEENLVAEAQMIQTESEIHLNEVHYLDDAEGRALARAKATKEKEADSKVTDEEIDQLLNQAKEF
jgi:hypothetical protein